MILFHTDNLKVEIGKKLDWRMVWGREDRFRDAVFYSPENRVAQIQLSGECEGHRPDAVCIRCLDRMETALARARKAILDHACPAPETEGALLDYPNELFLENHLDSRLFSMLLEGTSKLVSRRAFPECVEPGKAVVLFEKDLQCSVMKTYYVCGIKISVTDALLKALPDAIVDVYVDGELLVSKTLPAMASLGLVALPEKNGSLFRATLAQEGGGAFAGYMLPHNTNVKVVMGMPPHVVVEGGVTVECPMGIYRTNPQDPGPKKKPDTKDLRSLTYRGAVEGTFRLDPASARYQFLTPHPDAPATVEMPRPDSGIRFVIQNDGLNAKLNIKDHKGVVLTILRPLETVMLRADGVGWLVFCGVAPTKS